MDNVLRVVNNARMMIVVVHGLGLQVGMLTNWVKHQTCTDK